MKFNQIRIYSLLMIIVLSSTNCIEEFIPETISFENLLVVEALITNEYKFHEVTLSRTFEFDESQKFETEAHVTIVDNLDHIISFQETQPGRYISTIAFHVELGKTYKLLITTKDNISYASKEETLPKSVSQLDDIVFSKTTNDSGEDGVDILISSFDSEGNSKYYRYEYEETYKIVAPLWAPDDAIVISNTRPFSVSYQPRTQEERVCYNTVVNKTILQTETNHLTEDRVTKFPLKFVSKESPTFRSRYSIYVKQYVQSFEAYSYYKTLNELTSSESLFSENQPGFFNGNMVGVTNPDEKVLGFFEIASFSSRRVFVSFEDLYPNEGRAPYFTKCDILAPLLNVEGSEGFSPLIDAIEKNTLKFIEVNLQPNEERPGPFLMTQRACGDCTFYGSNVKPDFWID